MRSASFSKNLNKISQDVLDKGGLNCNGGSKWLDILTLPSFCLAGT